MIMLLSDKIFKKKLNLIVISIYIMVQLIVYNTPNTFFCISLYYQIISFLNTKNNMLVIILISITFLKNLIKKNNCVSLILLIVFYIFYINTDGYLNKTIYQNIHSNLTTLNNNLLNGIMLIHPIVLYSFYGIYILEYKVNFKKLNTQIKKIKSKKLNHFFFLNIFILVWAITLGGW